MKTTLFLCLLVAFGASANDGELLLQDAENTYWEFARTVPPNYPPKARKTGVTGLVNVMFTVSTKGRVTDIEIIKSEPPGVFDKATLKALRKFRYKPTEQNPERKPARVSFAMGYELK